MSHEDSRELWQQLHKFPDFKLSLQLEVDARPAVSLIRIHTLCELKDWVDEHGVHWINARLVQERLDQAWRKFENTVWGLARRSSGSVNPVIAWVPDGPAATVELGKRLVNRVTFEEIIVTKAVGFCRRMSALEKDAEPPEPELLFHIHRRGPQPANTNVPQERPGMTHPS